LQLGGSVFPSAPIRRFCELCHIRPLPEPTGRFRAPLRSKSLLARWSRPTCVSVLAHSSNLNPSGSLRRSDGSKLPSDLTRLERGFYFAPRRTVPCSHFLTGATPSRGTGESCLTNLATGRGSVDQLHRPFPGHPGLSLGRLQRFFHSAGRRVLCGRPPAEASWPPR
jgi:hypothetical protein